MVESGEMNNFWSENGVQMLGDGIKLEVGEGGGV